MCSLVELPDCLLVGQHVAQTLNVVIPAFELPQQQKKALQVRLQRNT